MKHKSTVVSRRRRIRTICTVFDLMLIISITMLVAMGILAFFSGPTSAAIIGSYGFTGLAAWSFFKNIFNF
jgi:hypothetical protein